MKRDLGFTLMELMITIAIIGVMSTIALPSVMSWRENTQLQRAARDVYSDFQKAKSDAVKRNTWCSLDFTAGGYSVFVDANNNIGFDAGEPVLTTLSWSDYGTITVQSNTFPGSPMAFADDGLVRGALGGSIVLQNGRGDQTSVIVSQAGNIRISP